MNTNVLNWTDDAVNMIYNDDPEDMRYTYLFDDMTVTWKFWTPLYHHLLCTIKEDLRFLTKNRVREIVAREISNLQAAIEADIQDEINRYALLRKKLGVGK